MLKQKLHDLLLILKNSRKAWFFIGIGVFSILFLNFYDSRPQRRLIPRAPVVMKEDLIADEQSGKIIESFGSQVDKLKNQSVKIRQDSLGRKKEMDHFEGQVVSIFGKMLNRLTEAEQKLDEALQRIDKVPDSREREKNRK